MLQALDAGRADALAEAVEFAEARKGEGIQATEGMDADEVEAPRY